VLADPAVVHRPLARSGHALLMDLVVEEGRALVAVAGGPFDAVNHAAIHHNHLDECM
jgi:hypothetical protein